MTGAALVQQMHQTRHIPQGLTLASLPHRGFMLSKSPLAMYPFSAPVRHLGGHTQGLCE